MQESKWERGLTMGCGLLLILIFLATVIFSAFTGRRQPLPAGAYDPRIYPEQPKRLH